MFARKFDGKHSDVTELILKSFFQVYRRLGYGFGERVYENALAIELRRASLVVQQQPEFQVHYDGHLVGSYCADLVVNEVVMVELKAATQFAAEHEAQLLSYLKATRYEVGLLLNFGPTPEFKRRVFDNDRKGSLDWTQS